MARAFCWLVVVALLGGFAALLVLLLSERVAAGRGLPPYSVYSEGSDGLAQAGHLLRRLGWRTVAVTRPIQTTHFRGLLILVPPGQDKRQQDEDSELSRADAEALLRWVRQGNTLLLASRSNTPIHQIFKAILTDERGPADTFTPAELGAAGGYLHGVEHLSLGSRATLRAPSDALPLWWLGDRPGALLIRHGKGRVLLVADPGLLTQHGLIRDDGEPRDDNAVFLANVVALNARDGTVYFDEYHHGIRGGGGFWGYLALHGERLAVLPLLVVLVIAGWAVAVRLGPAVPTPRKARADAVDYASALGRLYQRTGARRLLARTLVRGFLDGMTRHLRLRRQALPAVILATWRQQHAPAAAGKDLDPSTARLQGLLRGVSELRRGEMTDQQLLSWARNFDQFLAETDRPR
jgi:hypothetical protein